MKKLTQFLTATLLLALSSAIVASNSSPFTTVTFNFTSEKANQNFPSFKKDTTYNIKCEITNTKLQGSYKITFKGFANGKTLELTQSAKSKTLSKYTDTRQTVAINGVITPTQKKPFPNTQVKCTY